MRHGRAVEQPSVVKEVIVSEVIPLTTRETQVACGAIFKALQAVVHQNLAVGGVLLAWEFKPATARAVVGGGRVVLGFPRVGLNPSGVAWICFGRQGQTQKQGHKRESYTLHDGGDLDPQNSVPQPNRGVIKTTPCNQET